MQQYPGCALLQEVLNDLEMIVVLMMEQHSVRELSYF